MTISRSILLPIINISDKSCCENQTHISCPKTFFLSDRVVKHVRARWATDDDITPSMHFACWITKATDTHSEYVTFIAFPQKQWLREHASMSRYMYIGCLVTLL